MRTPLFTACLLLAALAPVAGAAELPDPCETARCEVAEPPAEADCGRTATGVGVSCTYAVDGLQCVQAQWGVHSPDLVVGGNHGCHAMVRVGPVTVEPAGFAQPCSVDPTWPGGHATCTVGDRTVGCGYWTGALLPDDPARYACGVTGCDPGGFHADGAIVSAATEGCIVHVLVDAAFVEQVTEPLTSLVAPGTAPCTIGPEVACDTPAGSCAVFLNRWSYGGCDTVLACLPDALTAQWGRLSVHADACSAGFHLQG